MQSLDAYRQHKLKQTVFRQFYERECHVCRHTVGIFEQMLATGRTPEQLVAETDADLPAIMALLEADRCDPGLVLRLCRHLGIEAPPDCPRMSCRS